MSDLISQLFTRRQVSCQFEIAHNRPELNSVIPARLHDAIRPCDVRVRPLIQEI